MVEAVIFDMDGVIVDSEYTFFQAKTAILREEGITVDESYHYQFMGTTGQFMWEKMKEEFHLPQSVERYILEMNQRRKAIIARDGIKMIPFVDGFIKELKQKGIPLGVASSSSRQEILTNLETLHLLDYFQEVVSSEEVAYSKPAPDVFLEVAKRLNIASNQCIVIEDTKNGSEAAKAAGMYCIGYVNPHYPRQAMNVDECISDFRNASIQLP